MDLGLSRDELEECWHEAGKQYLLDGNADVFTVQLRRLGFGQAEIIDELKELRTKRAEAFNALLARVHDRHRGAV